MNSNDIIEFAKVMIIWGFWIMVYGTATMTIGFTILLLWGKQVGKLIIALLEFEL